MNSKYSLASLTVLMAALASQATVAAEPVTRSAANGAWSAATTWEGAQVPAAGARVLIRPGHTVTYDVKSDAVIRAVQIGGTLTFARDRDTLLNVGLVRVAPGEEFSEEGFDCDAHLPAHGGHQPEPAVEVGTAQEPIPAGKTAILRLADGEGMNK